MNFLGQIFNIFLYQPLFNALVLLYQFLPGNDFGIAVIILTVLIRLMLFPLMTQSLRAQKTLSGIQGKVKDIQKKHKENKEKQMKAIMELYQKEKINPYASLVPLFIQLPLLIALYRVFWGGLEPESLNFLYSFVARPTTINPLFLNIIDLSQPSLFLAVVAGASQFFQSKEFSSKRKTDNKFAEVFSGQAMLYFFPIFTIIILLKIPAAVALYWIIGVLFSLIQQRFFNKSNTNG